jgi:hypothetical protein
MKSENSFVVSRFKNRNGTVSWRVSGWLSEVRIRKNFKTREEAAAEKSALELKAMHAVTNTRAAATCLTEEQLREAESAFNRLKDLPRSW